ncbi:MAG: M12 family metallo-peptidase [bacterium]|nr:M12 family metallo-peptidase [bacterium]
MQKLTTRFVTLTLTTALVVVTSLYAGENKRSIDARQILTASPSKDASVQATAFSKPLNLQRVAAEQLFAERLAELQFTNFPLPGRPDGTLNLRRTRDVIDASSEIYVGTKNGPKRITLRPVTSYIGTLNDDANTRVSLHYSTDDLTGIIDMADGSRLVIGRDGNASVSAVPHAITVEGSVEGGSLLKNFTCGVEDSPVTIETLERASKNGQVEVVQNGYLKQMRIALEIKEDIDSVMKRRGMNDEQILQYFVKVWAAVSQVYEQELNATVLLSYVMKYSTDDPSPYTGNGFNPSELLGQFSTEWRQRAQPQRTLAHLLALIRPIGGSYVGGIAYGGNMSSNLCNPTSQNGSYSVSTVYTNATDVPGMPTRANGFVWDIFVIAHEMGHNVGANHTHNCSWNPPVDTCQLGPSIDGTDGCVNNPSMRRPRAGTIMSYCHLVNGSTTPLTFGTRPAERMAEWIASSSCITAPGAPMVRITYPRGSEEWNSGDNVDILWVSEGVAMVKLEFSPDGGGQWTDIAGLLPAADKKYTWRVPAVGTTNLLIRLSDQDNAAVADTSLAKYAIKAPVLPAVTLIKPVGGERIRAGSVYTITWNRTADITTVTVDFAPDGVTFGSLVVDTNATSYSWRVPEITTSNAKIRVRSSANPNVTSTSGDITIGSSRFELVKPRTGDTICTKFDNGFIWSADFISRIKIRYMVTGSTLKNAISSITVPVGPGFLISAAGSQLKNEPSGTAIELHIINDDDDSTLLVVTGLVAADCDKPNSVDEDAVSASDLSVVGVTPSPASQNAVLTLTTSKPMTLDIVLVDMQGNTTTLLGNVRIDGAGVQYLNLPVQSVASGAYMVSVRSGGFAASVPLRIAR